MNEYFCKAPDGGSNIFHVDKRMYTVSGVCIERDQPNGTEYTIRNHLKRSDGDQIGVLRGWMRSTIASATVEDVAKGCCLDERLAWKLCGGAKCNGVIFEQQAFSSRVRITWLYAEAGTKIDTKLDLDDPEVVLAHLTALAGVVRITLRKGFFYSGTFWPIEDTPGNVPPQTVCTKIEVLNEEKLTRLPSPLEAQRESPELRSRSER